MENINKLNIKLEVIEDEIRVSALTIAENTGNSYDSIRDRVLQYKDELGQFGDIPTAVFKTAVGKQAKSVSLLNESQSTLLITFLKNGPQAIRYLKRLKESAQYEIDDTNRALNAECTEAMMELMENDEE